MIKIKKSIEAGDVSASQQVTNEDMPGAIVAAIELPGSTEKKEQPEGMKVPVPEPLAQMTWMRNKAKECQEEIGWFSPVYHTSRGVTLDAVQVTENRCLAFMPESREMDSYKVVRSRIVQHFGMRGGVTIMVTSALPGEGKTLTSINLSCAFAQEFNHTVLLADCDLRQQKIHEILGYASDKGLSDHLLDACPVAELTVWPGIEKLTVISGGRKMPSASALLGSPQMKALVEDLKGRYPERYVIFDAPPLLGGADALALIPLVDYVLVVVQAGRTALEDVRKAMSLIPKEKVLGLILNRENGTNPFTGSKARK
jgi:non-specific protein-tyrosine kinase